MIVVAVQLTAVSARCSYAMNSAVRLVVSRPLRETSSSSMIRLRAGPRSSLRVCRNAGLGHLEPRGRRIESSTRDACAYYATIGRIPALTSCRGHEEGPAQSNITGNPVLLSLSPSPRESAQALDVATAFRRIAAVPPATSSACSRRPGRGHTVCGNS